MHNNHHITKVALDLDGVLANFCKAAAEKMGRHYPQEPFAVPNLWLDDDKKALWKSCRGHDFWVNIEPFPWAKKLIRIVNSNCNDWRFITKPSVDAGAYSGKFEWITKHTKGAVKEGTRYLWLVNGCKSYACTGPHHLLIDDNDENCAKWKEAGGTVYQWTEISANWPEKEVEKRLLEIKNLFKY